MERLMKQRLSVNMSQNGQEQQRMPFLTAKPLTDTAFLTNQSMSAQAGHQCKVIIFFLLI
jgi:hypothetical protein